MKTVPRCLLAAAFALAIAAPLVAQEPPKIDIQVSPATGVESVTPTITWNATGVQSCTATGGWSGAKPLSGTETLPAIDRSLVFGLVCTTKDGRIVLSWTPPTQNTNGTALTDLAGFKVYTASTQAGLATATPTVLTGADVKTHTIPDAPVGMTWVALSAYNSKGIESDRSAAVSKDVKQTTTTAEKTVEVQTKPNPPTATAIENGTN